MSKNSIIKDENYFVIAGWMMNKLGLKNNELSVYAIIYGYSQNSQGKFTGSLRYLADFTNVTKQGVIKSLKMLCERGLIDKEEFYANGVKYVSYKASELTDDLIKTSKEIGKAIKSTQSKKRTLLSGKQSLEVVNKVHHPSEQSLTTSEQSLPNIIEDNIEDNIEKVAFENFEKVSIMGKPKKHLKSELEDDLKKSMAYYLLTFGGQTSAIRLCIDALKQEHPNTYPKIIKNLQVNLERIKKERDMKANQSKDGFIPSMPTFLNFLRSDGWETIYISEKMPALTKQKVNLVQDLDLR